MAEPKVRFKRDDGSSYPEWENDILGNHCIFYNGDRGKNYPSTSDYVTKGLPFINAGDLDGKHISDNCVKISKEKYEQLGGAKLVRNDILYCLRGSLGKMGIVDFDTGGTVASSLIAIRATDVDYLYMYYFLGSPLEYNQRKINDEGLAQPNLSAKNVGRYLMPIPCLEEQRKIADFLSSVDDVISTSEQEVANLETQKKAVMKKIFSQEVRFKRADGSVFPEWRNKVFTDVAQLVNGRAYSADEMLESGKYMILRVGNLFSNNEYYYSDMELEEDKYINDGDLIYAWSATFGPRIYHGDKCIYHYHIWKVIPYSVEKDYFLHFLYADVDNLQSELNGGTMKHITKELMEKRIVPLPCKDEQLLIADFLSDFDEAIAAAKKELELWKKLKKGLLQQMFV